MSLETNPNTALKTNLNLAVVRLKLLQKKKTDLAQKTRINIKDFIVGGKAERAKILAEHVIREDYLIEALEMVEMYCDLLLVRFDILTHMKQLDEGLREAVASLIWVAPRIQSDIPEIKIICDLLMMKFGKALPDKSRIDVIKQVNRKLQSKLLIQCPSRMLVERYLVEIANCFNIEYRADEDDTGEEDGSGNSLPITTAKSFFDPPLPSSGAACSGNFPKTDTLSQNNFFRTDTQPDSLPLSYSSIAAAGTKAVNVKRSGNNSSNNDELLQFPSVPSHPLDSPSDDAVDGITKRFREFKKQ